MKQKKKKRRRRRGEQRYDDDETEQSAFYVRKGRLSSKTQRQGRAGSLVGVLLAPKVKVLSLSLSFMPLHHSPSRALCESSVGLRFSLSLRWAASSSSLWHPLLINLIVCLPPTFPPPSALSLSHPLFLIFKSPLGLLLALLPR